MGHYVYKYVLHQEVIYIGKNNTDLVSRLNQHGRVGDNIPKEGWDEINSAEIYYCELANKIMSDVVESELIRRYKPKYNKAKTSNWSGLEFVEQKWKKYINKEDLEFHAPLEIEYLTDEIEKLKNENKTISENAEIYKSKVVESLKNVIGEIDKMEYVIRNIWKLNEYDDKFISYNQFIKEIDLYDFYKENLLLSVVDKEGNEHVVLPHLEFGEWDKNTIILTTNLVHRSIKEFKDYSFRIRFIEKNNNKNYFIEEAEKVILHIKGILNGENIKYKYLF